jgi:hypothetical protein
MTALRDAVAVQVPARSPAHAAPYEVTAADSLQMERDRTFVAWFAVIGPVAGPTRVSNRADRR